MEGKRSTIWSVLNICDLIVVIYTDADFDDGAWGGGGDVAGIWVIAVDEGDAVAGDDVEKSAEAEFDFLDVLVDVGVVEFDVVDDDALGKVVEEFGAFVEEGGIVFVAFEDGERGVGKEGAAVEVFRNAANHP